MKNSFVHLPDIPGCEPKLFVKWKCIFNEFFNPASGIDFCLLETVFLSLEIWQKFWSLSGVTFLRETLYSCSWKLILYLVEANFFHFSYTPASESYFLSGGNVFLNEFFIPSVRDGFSVIQKSFSLSDLLNIAQGSNFNYDLFFYLFAVFNRSLEIFEINKVQLMEV